MKLEHPFSGIWLPSSAIRHSAVSGKTISSANAKKIGPVLNWYETPEKKKKICVGEIVLTWRG
jgi:hypothetical protein